MNPPINLSTSTVKLKNCDAYIFTPIENKTTDVIRNSNVKGEQVMQNKGNASASPSKFFPFSSSTSSINLYSSFNSQDVWLLHFHGGGFCINRPPSFKIMLDGLCRGLGYHSTVISPAYRRSPEYAYPCALNDAIDAYDYLLNSKKVEPHKIAFIGDSCGGNLAITTALKSINICNLPPPSCIVAFSPWLDLTHKGWSHMENSKKDVLLATKTLQKGARMYLTGNLDEKKQKNAKESDELKKKLKEFHMEKGMPYYNDYNKYDEKELLKKSLISPVYIDNIEWMKKLPPTLIHVGTVEVLLSDSLTFGRRVNLTLKGTEEKQNSNDNNKIDTNDKQKTTPISSSVIENEIASYGRIDDVTQKRIDKYKNCFVTNCELDDKKNKVFVKVWKGEFHVFPMFGLITSTNSVECLQETAQFISQQIQPA